MIRTFLAIPLPNEVKRALHEVQEVLAREGRRIKWVAPENLHITLSFLGDVERSKIPAIKEACQLAAAGLHPFKLQPKGTGVFPSPLRPRVFWAGLSGEVSLLRGLHERLKEQLNGLGFSPDDKEFKAHITIARARGAVSKKTIASFLEFQFEALSFEVERISIFSSTLRLQGPIYKELEYVTLK